MLQTIKLLLPALIPSWRFFSTIAPSPRIEFTLLKTAQEKPESWQEFRPRPAHLSISCMLKRLFFNARWNESLFLVTLAEGLASNPKEHRSQEILNRIKAELGRGSSDLSATPFLQFRLMFVHREGEHLEKHVMFISAVHRSFGDDGQ